MIDRFIRIISRLLLAASAIALALMVAILSWQVFARYVLDYSPAWAEQTALMLMIWLTFLGTASGIAEGFHIRIVEGVANLPETWKKRVVQLANLLIILAALLIVWLGILLAQATWGNAVPTLPLTRGMVYLVIPFSGALIAVFALDKLLRGEEISGSQASA
ncbi:TRAP transporter small permease [Altericroceibacterium endophyticum]|uniref:TRAP transporter small permease protein n=1 Tax=Altericroceibacterium endophyticum TaxID=1808508 RepID=A0A6I4T315_9SPHN|nr:TRAP transporter small permease [Altericroceibacterium endophyticum]MXO64503.1 TRAP transporter small permease subunit [Altericroceibacterium endophyticum]